MSKKDIEYTKFSEMPYYNTKVSEEKSRLDIEKLLRKYDANPILWLSDYSNNKLLVRFGMKVIDPNNPYLINDLAIMIDIPPIRAKKGNKIIIVPNSVSLRIFYYYLKSTLEAIKYGVLKKQDAFYAFTYVQLPDSDVPIRVKDAFESQLLLTEGTGKDIIK